MISGGRKRRVRTTAVPIAISISLSIDYRYSDILSDVRGYFQLDGRDRTTCAKPARLRSGSQAAASAPAVQHSFRDTRRRIEATAEFFSPTLHPSDTDASDDRHTHTFA